jgi:uncharacterized protein (TIGR03083 family)
VESDPRLRIAALRRSHQRLAGLVASLTPEQLRAQSYCADWSVAQVLSHLGSGAEIALTLLPSTLDAGARVGTGVFQPIWDSWNAKSPDDQAADALTADERHIAALEALTDDQLSQMKLDFFGMQLDATGIVRLRLGEHALHTWDIAVFGDPAAEVSADAAALLIDTVPSFLAPRIGKPLGEPFAVRITTVNPDRDYLLRSADPVTVTDWADSGEPVAELQMPAESLLRLVYGRLDRAHTPGSVTGDMAALAKLRAMFPGF